MKKIYCSYCGKNSENNKYCDHCGSEILKQKEDTTKKIEDNEDNKEIIKTSSKGTGECRACKYKNQLSDKYCSSCGATL